MKKHLVYFDKKVQFLIFSSILFILNPILIAGPKCQVAKLQCQLDSLKKNDVEEYNEIVDSFIQFEKFKANPNAGRTHIRNLTPILGSMYGTAGDGYQYRITASGVCMDPNSSITALSITHGNLFSHNTKLGGIYALRRVKDRFSSSRAALAVAVDTGTMYTELDIREVKNIKNDLREITDRYDNISDEDFQRDIHRTFDLSKNVTHILGYDTDTPLQVYLVQPNLEYNPARPPTKKIAMRVACITEYNANPSRFEKYLQSRR